jgi:hypothetical protein
MLSLESIREFRESWLPNVSDVGLDRLMDLLSKNSPLLIQGCFTRALPMGCLATHIAWNHPQTEHLTVDAGITWMNQIARLNPATSLVIREWDCATAQNWEIRAELLALVKEERQARKKKTRQLRGSRALVEV